MRHILESAASLTVGCVLVVTPCLAVIARAQAPTVPLPVVVRTKKPGPDPFDRAVLVVRAKIWQKSQVEQTNFEGESLTPVRFWTFAKAKLLEVVRLNERASTDSDLASGQFLLEQIARKEHPIPLEFGREYLLLIKPSRDYNLQNDPSPQSAPYEFAVPQGGFEIVRDRLVPLVTGGDLDKFRGRLLSSVVQELQSKP
jgi:hypothetical protein